MQKDRRAEFILAVRENGIVAAFESQVYRPDGSIIWIPENARAVRDEVTGELLRGNGAGHPRNGKCRLVRQQKVLSLQVTPTSRPQL